MTAVKHAADYSNTKELGRLIYTDYVYPFELAAVLLLVAMVAAIALTCAVVATPNGRIFRKQVKVKKQRSLAHRFGVICAKDGCSTRYRRTGKWIMPQIKAKGRSMLNLGLSHYLVLSAVLFAISVVGIFLNRKNLIVLLMAIELMLLAVNTNFVAFSHYLNDTAGQVFVFFILTVAAAEAAIGLAILVVLFRNLNTINVDDLDSLKG